MKGATEEEVLGREFRRKTLVQKFALAFGFGGIDDLADTLVGFLGAGFYKGWTPIRVCTSTPTPGFEH